MNKMSKHSNMFRPYTASQFLVLAAISA